MYPSPPMEQCGQYVRITNKALATFNEVGVIVDFQDSINGISNAVVLFASGVKFTYNTMSLKALAHDCIWVEYNNMTYMVTPKNNIICRKTGRIMNWSNTHPSRVVILKLSDEVVKCEIDDSAPY